MPALLVLERAYARLKRDASFQRELHGWLKRYAGRPTRLYFADHMSRATTATPRGICTTSTTPGIQAR